MVGYLEQTEDWIGSSEREWIESLIERNVVSCYQVLPWGLSCCAWCGCGAGRSAGDVDGAGADWLQLESSSTNSKIPPGPTKQ